MIDATQPKVRNKRFAKSADENISLKFGISISEKSITNKAHRMNVSMNDDRSLRMKISKSSTYSSDLSKTILRDRLSAG